MNTVGGAEEGPGEWESCWGERGSLVWQESTGLVAKDMSWNPSSSAYQLSGSQASVYLTGKMDAVVPLQGT